MKYLIPVLAVLLAAPLMAAPVEVNEFLEIGAQLRERYEWNHNYDLDDDISDSGDFVGSRIRFNVKIKTNENTWGFIQFQDTRMWGGESGTIGSTATDTKNVDLHQGFVVLDNIYGKDWLVKVGRQELSYGDQRLIGAFGWSNVGRSFDAVKSVIKFDRWQLDAFLAEVVELFTAGTPMTGQNDQFLYGIHTTNDLIPNTTWDIYGFWLQDQMEGMGEDPTEGKDTSSIYTFGTRIKGAAFDKRFLYSFEAAIQGGHKKTDSHDAWAGHAGLGWVFMPERNAKVYAEYNQASGDDDGTDGKSNEFHNLLPTNHSKYGTMDRMGWRNMKNIRVGVSAEIWNGITASLDFHDLRLAEKEGAWKSAGGTVLGMDATGMSGTNVGQEYDIAIGRGFRGGTVKLNVGYSHFEPGNFAKKTRGDDAADWGFFQFMVNL